VPTMLEDTAGNLSHDPIRVDALSVAVGGGRLLDALTAGCDDVAPGSIEV
jgi:hypothetical protein